MVSTRACLGIAVVLLFGLVLALPSALGAAPGSPGVPQAPVVVYTENFENGVGATPIKLNTYVGASPLAITYTAAPTWLTGCNGVVLSFSAPTTDPSNFTGCGTTANYAPTRGLAYSLGQFAGSPATANHALTAYTLGNPGANLVMLETVNAIPLSSTNRFLASGFDAAAQSCFSSHPQLSLALVNGSQELPAFATAVDGCTAPRIVPNPITPSTAANTGVHVGTFTSSASILFPGASVRLRLRNANGGAGGNDGALDNLRLLDVTPQLDKTFSPSSIPLGGGAALTFTVTNTSELGAKTGWSFVDSLPAGLQVASPSAATTTCSAGMVTAPGGGGSITVSGNLTAGQTSCTASINVTASAAGQYTNGPSNVAATGVNPPGTADLLVLAPTGTTTPTAVATSGSPTACPSSTSAAALVSGSPSATLTRTATLIVAGTGAPTTVAASLLSATAPGPPTATSTASLVASGTGTSTSTAVPTTTPTLTPTALATLTLTPTATVVTADTGPDGAELEIDQDADADSAQVIAQVVTPSPTAGCPTATPTATPASTTSASSNDGGGDGGGSGSAPAPTADLPSATPTGTPSPVPTFTATPSAPVVALAAPASATSATLTVAALSSPTPTPTPTLTATATASPSPPQLTLAAAPLPPVLPGASVQLVASVANPGPGPASAPLTVTIVLPAGLSVVSPVQPEEWASAQDGQTVTLTSAAPLAAGEARPIVLDLFVGRTATTRAIVMRLDSGPPVSVELMVVTPAPVQLPFER